MDARAVTRWREPSFGMMQYVRMKYPEDSESEILTKCSLCLDYETRDEVIKCSEKGLREIIFVVGNDDDKSEITFEPLHPDPSQRSPRESNAFEKAEQFKAGLGWSWELEKATCPLPIVKVMTVQRKPLQQFTLFPRLPIEIQLSIWEFARVSYPRVLTMIIADDDDNGPELYNYRPPALTHACRISRRMIWKRLDTYVNRYEEKTIIYQPLNDIALLLKEGEGLSYREFSKKTDYKSIGFRYDPYGSDNLSAADAKTFVGLERIVIFLGNQVAASEITLELISEEQPPRQQVHERSKTARAQRYAQLLREDLENQSKKWKTY
jgi:hypothetical protein